MATPRLHSPEVATKMETLQSLCGDTAAMGMKHAEAVLGLGLRMEIIEQRMLPDAREDVVTELANRVNASQASLIELSALGDAYSAPEETPRTSEMQRSSFAALR